MIHPGERLSAYLDGELPPWEEDQLRAHLEVCPECRAELAEVHQARAALRSLPMADGASPVPLLEGPADPPVRRWRMSVAAAAGAVLLVVAVRVGAGSEPPPQQLDLGVIADQHVARAAVDPALLPARMVAAVTE